MKFMETVIKVLVLLTSFEMFSLVNLNMENFNVIKRKIGHN